MVTFVDNNGVLICYFKGQMNTSVCSDLEMELLDHISNYTGKILFDLSDVSYIASSFLRLCITTVKRVSSDRFNIVNANSDVYEIFEVSGLDDLINN